jgi:hypothetical protein
MSQDVRHSQFADRGSTISESKNQTNISINRVRAESAIISFIVGTLSAIVASYVYEHFLK